ncbi:EmrB/QacA family drug resistance transporter [Caballeronia terrestris]|uniref:EmrB/QacA family drug resistance transporter n=1 Tax=Caballeronia terrestris TaxID=1226301 RepID=A0A158IVL4_9BURK|nr:MFS transporter [Caballeronia terrestris]SAL60081.1 EmrB/QacA family drug resistance transporter [Caballeronia terrestris]
MPRPAASRGVLIAAILGSSMAFIDGTIVNVALPSLQASLHATASNLQWVVETYALTLASLLLLGGSLGDLYGRRRLFLAGVLIFAMASAWCGLAGTIQMLVAARAVQGIGAALLVPGSLSLISASFPEDKRGQAIGTWSAFTAITTAFGPVLGGWMVEHVSWRAVFFINVPIAAVAAWITLSSVPESRNESMPRKLDWPGSVLACLGLGCVTFALIEASRGGAVIATTAACGVLALVAFVVVETRSAAPMVPLSLFRSRTFSGANLITLFLYAALGGTMYFLPLNLIQAQHYTATEAGGALLPLILLIFALSRWSGGLIAIHGARLPLVIGPVIVAAGFAWLAWSTKSGSYWSTIFPPMIVLGLGMAICVAPLTTAVMNAVSIDDSGVASGVNNAVSRIAGLLAIAVFGLVLALRFDTVLEHRLDALALPALARHAVEEQRPLLAAISSDDPRVLGAVRDAFVDGYRLVLFISAVLALASAVCAQLLLQGKKPAG